MGRTALGSRRKAAGWSSSCAGIGDALGLGRSARAKASEEQCAEAKDASRSLEAARRHLVMQWIQHHFV